MATEHTNTFEATDNEGKKYVIFEFTEFHEGRSSSGSHRVAGLKSLQTNDGQAVNRIAKGKYRIIGFEEIDIFSHDPNAP